MTTSHIVVQEFTFSHIFPYHPQTLPITSTFIFLETPDWTWHHDLALNSINLQGQAAVRMYIFLGCLFAVIVLNTQFDPEFPFHGVPLNMAYPPYASPLPPPSPSIETDPSEANSSSSSSRGDQVVPKLALEGFTAMGNGFYTP